MSKPWENDSCATVQACYNVYPVTEAAALWCRNACSQAFFLCAVARCSQSASRIAP
ncbi:hypothetical protein LMG28614_03786 [Paraburkholderia ultramafica]|uniref:Uncharacterized protein n=1 Tax=Paraburkholderia ultramafica TaxID=1544867 RepID=A0A6S7BMW5_9BURK|nr:hypothetical protein LMG28614_03786 [Paraburkholderia ultramafica]